MNEVPTKIFIAYDGSQGADDIFTDLALAGLPDTAEALVGSAADFLVMPDPVAAGKAAVKSQRRRTQELNDAVAIAARGADRLRKQFPSWSVTSRATYGSPAWALIEEGDRFNADLFVVGAHGRSQKPGMLGEVARQIFTQSRRPVRIARAPRGGTAATPKLLFAFDNSEEAEAAMGAILRRNWPASTEIRVVSVLPPWDITPLAPPLPPKIGVAPFQAHLQKRLREHQVELEVDRCRKAGFTASGVVLEGEPVTKITVEAGDWGATSVLMGSRDLSFVRRLFLGSVSQRVAARALCSVEVVRHKSIHKGGGSRGSAEIDERTGARP